jgi:uncharacterized protein
MRGLFVDTAGWVACADTTDLAHKRAIAWRNSRLLEGAVLVSTDYIVDETLTLLRVRYGLGIAEKWWRYVDTSPRLRWEHISPERAEKARTIFFRYTDKEFSFTDCTSFVVMRELSLRNALTTDHHFEQAGFVILPQN